MSLQITLPTTEYTPLITGTRARSGSSAEGASCLVIDDDPALLDALPETLRLRLPGMAVETASSAQPAIESVKRRRFDIILCDLLMPGMNGLDLLDELRLENPHAALVLMSAHGGEATKSAALARGAQAFLEKPFERDLLTTTIQQLLPHNS